MCGSSHQQLRETIQYAETRSSLVWSTRVAWEQLNFDLRVTANSLPSAVHGSYGPTFGGGHDLHIADSANTGASSYSILGSTYECPRGQKRTFFTGVEKFTVTEYEVFGLNT